MRFPLASQVSGRGLHGLPPAHLINMYAAQAETLPEKGMWWLPTAGLQLFSTIGNGPIRGFYQQDGVLSDTAYVVSGNEVYSFDANGTATIAGVIASGSGRVSMSADSDQLVIVTDPEAYVVTAGGVVQITDPDFPSVSSVAYLNGYFYFTRRDTGEIIWSALGDAVSFDALDFLTAESSPDDAVAVIEDQLSIICFGRKTVEFFSSTSDPDNPILRRPGGSRPYGCASRDSIVQADNTIYWVGAGEKSSNIIYRLAGGDTPQVVSTPWISELLDRVPFSQRNMINGWAYSQRGKLFVTFDIPGLGSYALDVSTGQWHERQTWDRTLYRAWCNIEVFGLNLVGDRTTGELWKLSNEVYTDGDLPIRRTVSAYIPPQEMPRGSQIHTVALDGMKGHGESTGQGQDPQVMGRFSIDGGNTYSNGMWRAFGKIGEYDRRTIWRRRGMMHDRGMVCEFTVTDPINVVFTGIRVNDE